MAVSGTPPVSGSRPRRKHSVVGWVLLLASLALFGLAAFHLVRMFSRGYDYACTGGDGCTYNTPDISGDMSWISVGIPIAIVLLALSLISFTFHRIRSAWGSAMGSAVGAVGSAFGGGLGSSWAGTSSWGAGASVLSLIARVMTVASSRANAGNSAWNRMVWPGMSTPGGTNPGLPPGSVVTGGMFQPTPGSLPPGSFPPGSLPPGSAPAASAVTPSPSVLPPGTVVVPSGSGTGDASGTAPGAVSLSETIRAAGLDAEAVITGMHDVGMANGTTRMYELDLAVTIPGSSTYHVKHVAWVPSVSVGRLYAGERLKAKVDPANHNSMVLDLGS
ncbi:MAG TPA: hypothetical protein VNN79_03295 [Actinomycetota bacterium]|nr:hypothetical protein [Actinomycetota bacterium]